MIDFNAIYEQYFPFWKELGSSDREFLCENSTKVHFDTRQFVHDNSGCSGLFILKEGRLRLYMLSDEGKEITLYRLSPGEICMLSASCVLQSISFDVMWIMQQIVFMSIDKRLAIFLLEDMQLNHSDMITLTHEQIARHLGTAREVVTRMLKRFANDGIIEVTRKGIRIVHIEELQKLAE